MAQHTPGPWSEVGKTRTRSEIIGGKESTHIADVPSHAIANARLIAAAPDLLAALRDMDDLLQWLQDSGNLKSPIEPHPYGLGVMLAKQAARAAILKATGQEG